MTSQEYVQHVVGAAVPVVAPNGTFYGALSIAAPLVRTDLTRLGEVPLLQDAAERLARSLGLPPDHGCAHARQGHR
jgi:DNA-binding IclR family transcriptional regulator